MKKCDGIFLMNVRPNGKGFVGVREIIKMCLISVFVEIS